MVYIPVLQISQRINIKRDYSGFNGMLSFRSVPLPGLELILKVPFIILARSRIPMTPKFFPLEISFSEKPFPSSQISNSM
ncbi:MAG: hypothetical protein DWQ44_13605 [Bacteroidetes bacterium]|nr:MAG: hypothetical protein DWQ33_08415 [Bacteroidota bacterium]REK05703.1 MAG: hypothetical protein DWQ39_04640 [Bacteroidota bacterium]REK31991.1 MAG: hypothetical protein DWQ44_13605 [Bacteroidota bacterium]REK50055.1 MAG: hypothetical protein DWQ48_05825 [Bacteroidota bacterium]